MFQLAGPVQATIEIKKSRFIALLWPVASREEARQRLAETRQHWPDARHYCAVLLTASDSMLDDDGEPSGTAARPMYNVLQHKQLNNVLAVVVRYFGGIKLGAGGLVRAYTQAINQALLDATLQPVVQWTECRVAVAFADESRLRRHLADLGVAVQQAEYAQQVVLTLRLPVNQRQESMAKLVDAMSGAVTVLDGEPSITNADD